MKRAVKLFLVAMSMSLVLVSCGSNVASQLKKEMEEIKSQCPQSMGAGMTLTDANFYEKEKVLEYTFSIEGAESFDAATIAEMKKHLVQALSSEGSMRENLSVKMALKTYGYSFRYFYTKPDGSKLCEIVITKDDLK